MRRNYYRKLLGEINTENYQLVYQSRGKCEIYRDTGVSKNNWCEIFISKLDGIQKLCTFYIKRN